MRIENSSRSFRHILSFILCAILVLPYSSPTEANERTDLEYLIFRYAVPPGGLPEPANSHDRLLALNEILSNSAAAGRGHSLLNGSGSLATAKKRLNKSPSHQVVIHAGAKRLNTGHFAPVRFRVKRRNGEVGAYIRIYFHLSLAGTSRLSTSIVYAHKYSRSKVKDTVTSRPNPSTWVIRDTRTITVGEVNYVDHPRFGVLVVATPFP
ncbi:MAG TPA: hypothetical protein DHW07_00025 [Gammaproteobacteria bacterium]|nr:hypothetical protein [Gammaproteobacteria bacterium]